MTAKRRHPPGRPKSLDQDMQIPRIHVRILAGSVAALLSVTSQSRAQLYLDVNGTTAGSGITANANITWDLGATANWNTDAAGGAGTISTFTNGMSVNFAAGTDAATPYTVTLGGTVRTPAIGFLNNGNVTVTGGELDATGGLALNAGTTTGVKTIASSITGTGGLTINGSGSITSGSDWLALSGFNSFIGNVTVNSGVLQLANNDESALGDMSNKLILNGGALFNLGTGPNAGNLDIFNHAIEIGSAGGAIRVWGNTTITVYNSFTGTGALTKNDTGTLAIAGDNTFAGAVNVNAGILSIGNNSTTGSLKNAAITIGDAGNLSIRRIDPISPSDVLPSTITFGGAGATLEISPNDPSAVFTLNRDLGTSTSNGRFRVSGGTVNLVAGTDLTLKTVAVGLQSASNQGILNIVDGSTITAQAFDIGSNANGNSGTVNQTGGTVTIQAGGDSFRLGHYPNLTNPSSTYTMTGGTLDVTAVSANGNNENKSLNVGVDGQATMIVGGGTGAALVKAFALRFDRERTGLGNSASTLTISNNGTVEVGTLGILAPGSNDGVFLNGGTLRATGAATWNSLITANDATTSVVDTGTFAVTTGRDINGPGTINLTGTGSLVLDPGTGTNTVTAVLTGTTAITKSGAGTTVIATSSPYSGTITINGGALAFNAAYNSATVKVENNGAIAGESSVGSFTLGTTTVGRINVDAVTAGALSSVGDVTINTGSTVNITKLPTAPGPFTVFTYGGTLTGFANLTLLNAANYRTAIFNNTAGAVTLDIGSKDVVWSGATGAWDSMVSSNWNGGADKFAWGDRVTFDETGTTTAVTLTGELRPLSLVVNSETKNYSFAGDGNLNVIAGLTSLVKSGASKLTINSKHTYTGGTTINGGVLDLTGGGGLTGTIRGTVDIGAAGTLRLTANDATGYTTGPERIIAITINGGRLEVNTTTNQTFSNMAIVLTGGTIAVTPGFTGNTNIDLFNNGTSITTLASANSSVISVKTLKLRQNDTQFNVAEGAAESDLVITSSVVGATTEAGNHNLVKNGDGKMVMSSDNTYAGTTTINGGTLQIGDGGTTGTIGGAAVTVGNGASLTYKRSGAYTQAVALNSAMADAGTVNIDGGLALTLGLAGNFSGTFNILNGSLIYGVTNPVSTQLNAPDINLSPGTTLTNAEPSVHGHVGNVTMNNATWTTGAGTSNYQGENYQLNGNVNVVGTAPSFITRDAGRTDANAGISLNGQITFTVADVTGSSASDLIVSTEFEPRDGGVQGGVTKEGPGTMEFKAGQNHTYTGMTIVNAGTLLVNGSLSGGLTSVDDGGTLSGTGTLAETVVNLGGVLAPGPSIGTLHFSASLALLGTTELEINKTGLTLAADLVDVAQSLTLGGALNVTASGDALAMGDTFNLFDAGAFSGSFEAVNLPALTGGLNWDVTGLADTGVIAVVPEPSALLVMASGVGLLVGLRRRRPVC